MHQSTCLFKLKFHFAFWIDFFVCAYWFSFFFSNTHQIHNWMFGQFCFLNFVYRHTLCLPDFDCLLCAMNALILLCVIMVFGGRATHTSCQYWQISPQAYLLFFFVRSYRRFIRCVNEYEEWEREREEKTETISICAVYLQQPHWGRL